MSIQTLTLMGRELLSGLGKGVEFIWAIGNADDRLDPF